MFSVRLLFLCLFGFVKVVNFDIFFFVSPAMKEENKQDFIHSVRRLRIGQSAHRKSKVECVADRGWRRGESAAERSDCGTLFCLHKVQLGLHGRETE